MILSHPTFEHMIDFDNDMINILVVENQKQLCTYIQELKHQSLGYDGHFSLYHGQECISMNNIKVIIDLFNLDTNTKDVLTPISNIVIRTALDADHYQKTNDALGDLSRMMIDLLSDVDLMIESKELTIQDIVKASSIKTITSGEGILSTICDYLDLYSKYAKVKIFVFVNCREYLTDEEVLLLEQHILYNKLNVLFVESHEHKVLENESVTVIDDDLCEIRLS